MKMTLSFFPRLSPQCCQISDLHDCFCAEMALVEFTDELVLPAPREQETRIHGYPEGSLLNFVSWSDDSKYIAFTIRSAGEHGSSPSPVQTLQQTQLQIKASNSQQYLRLTFVSAYKPQAITCYSLAIVAVEGFGQRRFMLLAGGVDDPPRKPLELWVAEVATGQSKRLLSSPERGLNCTFDK